MKTTYLYKAYRDNVYLGCLPRPSNDFEYSQDINTPGIQIMVELPATLDDTGVDIDTDELITEDGYHLVTHNGSQIISRKDYVFRGVPINLANQLKVIKFHDGAVNGEVAFDGLITSWRTSYKNNNTTVTALSWGVKLDNYLIETAAGTPVVQQVTHDVELTQYTYNYNGTLVNDAFFAQTFKVLSSTTASSVKLLLRLDPASPPVPYVLEINSKAIGAFGPNLGYATRTVSNYDQEWIEFVFPSPVSLVAGTTYHFRCFVNTNGPTNGPVYLGTDSSGAYANGTVYIENPNGSGNYVDQAKDLSFQIITSSGGGNIGGNFLSKDPSNIVRELLDTFKSRGGLITYDDDSVQTSNIVTSYNFVFDTILDGIKQCLKLAPSNWYWYVHPGTNLLYFRRQSNTADHIMRIGLHLEDLDLEYTLDDVKNVVYFSGGDVGGYNLLTLNTNPYSQERNGVWLDKPSDGRVTLEDTANILSRGILNQNANPVFRTTITIPSTVYNIETFQIGQMVGFANGNRFINDLLLQIVGIDKKTHIAKLYLNSLPPTSPHRVEDIKRNLNAVQTVNNPSTVA